MKHNLRSGIWLLAATAVVFGGLYPVERAPDRKPFTAPVPLSDVKPSAGVGSTIKAGARLHDLFPFAHEAVAIEAKTAARIAHPWEVKRFKGQGLDPRLISVSTPVLGATSKVSFARAQCNDWEKHIRSLDETALQPLPDFDQDRIERERKKARQMMSGLDCINA